MGRDTMYGLDMTRACGDGGWAGDTPQTLAQLAAAALQERKKVEQTQKAEQRDAEGRTLLKRHPSDNSDQDGEATEKENFPSSFLAPAAAPSCTTTADRVDFAQAALRERGGRGFRVKARKVLRGGIEDATAASVEALRQWKRRAGGFPLACAGMVLHMAAGGS
ncbi:hypothetical protein EBH_0018880 [Eimeria brunetti]|uniref:Uncharacterized protein n=1 Tax=Eimeria brunetti TaxID=51314 RepID=U6LHP2_9EIME|nr:hypothetical protein EBH_0018880 [Eimeria brunetti]